VNKQEKAEKYADKIDSYCECKECHAQSFLAGYDAYKKECLEFVNEQIESYERFIDNDKYTPTEHIMFRFSLSAFKQIKEFLERDE